MTDRGQRREKNEDAFLLKADDGVLIVADGLGGRPAGEIASRMACDTAYAIITEPGSSSSLGDTMARAVESANSAIWQRGQERPDNSGMGTTLTGLHIDSASGRLGIGHVGDSRAYRYRNDRLECLTTDHTLVQELIDSGAITEADADGHPLGYLLNRAVGTEPAVEAQVLTDAIEPGDLFLLCTDGLLAVLNDHDIRETLDRHLEGPPDFSSDRLEAITANLVHTANERGAPDNVTVGMIGVPRAADPRLREPA